ncbi:putative membrane-associated trancriptional regulator [Halalkaliarchaeum sp. AArc-CO]|uniref:helix-turn-helix transcriptional regulator n=1 Tax=unclassified Halalkaliarchaeum TaxID=2678344 RepID=UPI00217CEAFB|nr:MULTISPECIES: hypothetical protein [unclassified Halalkaliarchaeum]MDR5672774.1 hypothetical protein [Halalkaliarchaeum sp. AArc-GB]UWG52329.1 putative membrane-associated trancriptional regulator [Halalkaliarchaeum sp. AArc-CO]
MDWRNRSLVFVLAVSVALVGAAILFAGPGIAGSGTATFGDTDPATFEDPFFQTDDADADDILLEADVDENGDAVWTVEYRFLLADEESQTAFEELETEIEENETPYVDRFRDRMESTVATAEESTGREMSVSDVTVETYRQTLAREYGVVVYSFTWGGFAAVEEDTILAGDAISGLFLDGDSRFVLAWPDGYEASEVRPDPTRSSSTSATWDGPFDFSSDEPRVTIVPTPAEPTDPTEPTEPGEPTDPTDPAETPISSAVIAGIFAIAIVAVAFVYLRRRSGVGDAGADDPGATATTGEDSTTGVAAGSEDGNEDDAEPTPPAEELLSPEERVLKLVREHGGRMKQQEVVREMDWTDARTSQVVGSLREDGKLESFRLGRENVLKLPDEDEQNDQNRP